MEMRFGCVGGGLNPWLTLVAHVSSAGRAIG